MRGFVGERTRAEPALRLWVFVGVCASLSLLLALALLAEGVARPAGSVAPVFLPQVASLYSFATGTHAESKDHDVAMRLVETLPLGDCALNSSLESTFHALLRRTQTAETSIDISAMYWNLLGAEDHKIYSDEQLAAFGAGRGAQLFQALVDAAQRGVSLRIVTAGDAIGRGKASPLPEELQKLVAAAPDKVSVHQWGGQAWYGGGILHQKIWIFDKQHVYVGSANMDWKSLAQVMEVGVLLEHLTPTSHVMQDIQRLFDVWWKWGELDASEVKTYYSERFQAELQVPAWSHFLPHGSRASDPFAEARLQALGNVHDQLKVAMNDGSKARFFVASAPDESTAAHTRTFDEDALVYTIATAQSRVSLSVMDFTPYSMYGLETHKNASIWWPALTDAILAGVFGKKGLHVRLLISQWQHSRKAMFEALHALELQAALCKRIHCGGSLEIKIFRVPGWQNTTTTDPKKPALWPAFTRVNHAKYIVSDSRVNIGTSNMEWGYFYTTAGISVNTDHHATRQAIEDIFNRNWQSSYAVPLSSVLP